MSSEIIRRKHDTQNGVGGENEGIMSHQPQPASDEPSSSVPVRPPSSSSSSATSSSSLVRDYRLLFDSFLILLLILSAIYFILLPERPLISQGMYIDENALMPGSTASSYAQSNTYPYTTTQQDKEREVRRMKAWELKLRKSASVRSWLLHELSTLPVSVGEYRSDPLSSRSALQWMEMDVSYASSINDTSSSVIHALWHAPNSDGKECLMLVTEYDEDDHIPLPSSVKLSDIHVATSGVVLFRSLMSVLTRAFTSGTSKTSQRGGASFLARDILFVFIEKKRGAIKRLMNPGDATRTASAPATSSSTSSPSPSPSHPPAHHGLSAESLARHVASESFDAFIDAYYSGSIGGSDIGANISNGHIISNEIQRSGNIHTAIMVDVPLQSPLLLTNADSDPSLYHAFSLDVVGRWGLLPNLDLPSVTWRCATNNNVQLVVAESAVNQLMRGSPSSSGNEEERPSTVAAFLNYIDTSVLSTISSFLDTHLPFLRRSWFSSSSPSSLSSRPRVFDADRRGSIRRSLAATFGVKLSDIPPLRWDADPNRARGLWRFMIQSITAGKGSGALHPTIGARAIDTLTIRAIPNAESKQERRRKIQQGEAATIAFNTVQFLDLLVRSLNNLSERLHHSTYWYLLNNRDDFTTMSKYIYVLVLFLLGIPIRAFVRLYATMNANASTSAVNDGQNRHGASGNTLIIVAAIYSIVTLAYLTPPICSSLIGGGKWSQMAMGCWCTLVLSLVFIYFFIFLPRVSLLRHRSPPCDFSSSSSSSSSPSSIPAIAAMDEVETLRDPSLNSRHLPPEKRMAARATPPLGQILPQSPPHLPMLHPSILVQPSHSSNSSLTPILFHASFDWRLVSGLVHLACLFVLVPSMVCNFSSTLLVTAVLLTPLRITSEPPCHPNIWWHAFKRIRVRARNTTNDATPPVNGVDAPITISSQSLLSGARYAYSLYLLSFLLCRFTQAMVLLVTSPISLLMFAAHFNECSVHEMLQRWMFNLHLATTSTSSSSFSTVGSGSGDWLMSQMFFVYAPCYLLNLTLAFGCRFEVEERNMNMNMRMKQH